MQEEERKEGDRESKLSESDLDRIQGEDARGALAILFQVCASAHTSSRGRVPRPNFGEFVRGACPPDPHLRLDYLYSERKTNRRNSRYIYLDIYTSVLPN